MYVRTSERADGLDINRQACIYIYREMIKRSARMEVEVYGTRVCNNDRRRIYIL